MIYKRSSDYPRGIRNHAEVLRNKYSMFGSCKAANFNEKTFYRCIAVVEQSEGFDSRAIKVAENKIYE